MFCTAITRDGHRCRRPATIAFIWRLDWRASCRQHRSYFASSETIELPLDQMGPYLRGEYVQGAERVPPTSLMRYEWAVYQRHVLSPTTTPHLHDPLADAIAHGYSGTLD